METDQIWFRNISDVSDLPVRIGARKRPAQDYSPPEADPSDPTGLVGTRQCGTITAWRQLPKDQTHSDTAR